MSRHLLLLGIPLLAAGCPADTERDTRPERLGTMSRPIFNGTPDTAADHGAVVVLDMGTGMCTGTLISPQVVLTAAHCLSDRTHVKLSVSDLRVGFGDSLDGRSTRWEDPASLWRHPDYNGKRTLHDLGLIRLRRPAPADIKPIPHLPASLGLTNADLGATLEFSGFGVTETDSSGVKLKVTDTIDYICTKSTTCTTPSGYQATPNTVCYDQQPGGPCSGDSGGPAFLWRDGIEYVAAVTSYGDEYCVSYGCSAKVDAYEDLINAFIAEPRTILGSACTEGAECESGFCADGVCCETACDGGACDTCLASAGAISDGVCTPTYAKTCDDGNVCTTDDRCIGMVCRGGLAVKCPASTDPCLADSVCNPISGQCDPPAPGPDGVACNDDNRCTRTDRCQDGVCTGFDPVLCAREGKCTEAAVCDPGTGACSSNPKPAGTACDDGNACTEGDACNDGLCIGSTLACTPPNACQVSSGCERGSGCVFTPLPDGTACGKGTCQAGECIGASGCGCTAGAGEAPAVFALLALLGMRRRAGRRATRG